MKKYFLQYSVDAKKLNARLKFNRKFQNNKFSDWIKKRLGKISKNDNILDLGCGNGAQSFYFAKKNTEGKLYSIDLSKESISYLKNKILRKNFFPLCMDMNNISIKKTNFFDIINSCYSFYYARNAKKLFSKCYSLLRENGKLIVTTPMAPHFIVDLAKKVHPINKKVTDSLLIYKKIIKEMDYKKMKVRIFYFNSYMSVKNYYDLFKFYENSTFYNKKFKLILLKKMKNMFKNKKVYSFKKKSCMIVGIK
jgi:SAM-dependent methyltransferase